MGDDEAEDGLVHDEVEIEDFKYDPDTDTFNYPCPCGDEFAITREELLNGGKYAKCPSCSLTVLVIYNIDDLESLIEVKSGQKDSQSTKNSGVRASS